MLENGTIADLERACAENHRELFRYNTKAVGGDLNERDGLFYYYTKKNGSNIAFPSLLNENVRAKLDELVTYYRSKEAYNIGFWSLDPITPPDLDVYLLARGFQDGWQPRWMVVDFSRTRIGTTTVDGVIIQPDHDVDVSGVPELPYASDDGAVSAALFKSYPSKVQRIVARKNGLIVGHCCLFFGSGDYGVTGIYNVGVIPSMRNQGIGLAIMQEANKYAASHGYRYAILNANDQGWHVYEKAGYKVIGYGKTWWITNRNYITDPVVPELTKLAECVALGDISTLEMMFGRDSLSSIDSSSSVGASSAVGPSSSIGASSSAGLLNTLLPNNLSLIQIAAHFKQFGAAQWLVDHGATFSALDAWDLGWFDRAESLLKLKPDEINRSYYDWQGNLLHVAAERNDLKLAKLALEHNVDLQATDKHHGGTPIGWAMFFKRDEIIELIRSYEKPG